MAKAPDPKLTAAAEKSVIESAPAILEAVKARAVSTPRLIQNSHQNEVVKGNQHLSSAWFHAPANCELLAVATQRLVRVSKMRNKPTKRVRFVRAAMLEGDTNVYIYPTEKEDPEAIQVLYIKSSAWINLITLLSPVELTLETGYRERYAIDFATDESPVGPALVMDLSRKLDRKLETKRYKAQGAPVPASDPTL